MSQNYFKRKCVCVFLGFVFLLQSCAVYQKTPVSITEAAATNHKVLIIKTDDTKLKLKKIEQIDGIYYGITKDNGKIAKIPLSESDIKTIRVLDKTVTTIGNVAIVVGSMGIVLLVVAAIELSNELSNWGDDWGDWDY